MSTGGKGSKRIPTQVPRKQFEDNWELAFGKDKKDKKEEKK